MNVSVNGRPLAIPDGLTLAGLLEHLGRDASVAAEVNGGYVPRRLRGECLVREGDVIRIVEMALGG